MFGCGTTQPHVCTKAVPTANFGWAATGISGRRRLIRRGCGCFLQKRSLHAYPASHEGGSRRRAANVWPFSNLCFPRSDPKRTVCDRFGIGRRWRAGTTINPPFSDRSPQGRPGPCPRWNRPPPPMDFGHARGGGCHWYVSCDSVASLPDRPALHRVLGSDVIELSTRIMENPPLPIRRILNTPPRFFEEPH